MPLRVATWNVSSGEAFLRVDPTVLLARFERKLGDPIDVLALQELRAKEEWKREMLAGALPGYRFYASYPKEGKHGHFGAGVGIYLREEHTQGARLPELDWDVEGRVAAVDLPGLVTLMSVYSVNGTLDSKWIDPSTGQVKKDQLGFEMTRHDARKDFDEKLLSMLRAIQAEGRQIILLGDMNVQRAGSPGHDNNGCRDRFERMIKQIGLADAYLDRGKQGDGISYYSDRVPFGGKKPKSSRVDYVLHSEGIGAERAGVFVFDGVGGIRDFVPGRWVHAPVWAVLEADV